MAKPTKAKRCEEGVEMGFALFFINIYFDKNTFNFGFFCFKKGECFRSFLGFTWIDSDICCDLLWFRFGGCKLNLEVQENEKEPIP